MTSLRRFRSRFLDGARRAAYFSFCLTAMATAVRADSLFLPRGKAEVRHAVTGCESFGPGFRKVEGSDTCIRLGGSVGVEATVSSSGGSGALRR